MLLLSNYKLINLKHLNNLSLDFLQRLYEK